MRSTRWLRNIMYYVVSAFLWNIFSGRIASENVCAVCATVVPLCATVLAHLGTLLAMADGRFLPGPHAKLRAKLTEKTRTRSYKLLRKRFPAGTKELAAVPQLAASSRKVATAQQVQQYEENIRSASSTFASHHLDEGTLEEDDNYMVWINQWATLSGFGTFIVINMKVRCARVTW